MAIGLAIAVISLTFSWASLEKFSQSYFSGMTGFVRLFFRILAGDSGSSSISMSWCFCATTVTGISRSRITRSPLRLSKFSATRHGIGGLFQLGGIGVITGEIKPLFFRTQAMARIEDVDRAFGSAISDHGFGQVVARHLLLREQSDSFGGADTSSCLAKLSASATANINLGKTLAWA